ncbi:MAG: hypothetical protein E7302_06280 [Butyrivibrio sp.]|nr:hypothetical protein [Butyrivibrio sp.]
MNTSYKHEKTESSAYSERKIKSIVGTALFTISFGILLYCSYLCLSNDIWYDELFSIEFAKRPISEMIKLTAADVHPPLYYIIVHFAISVSEAIHISPIMGAKLASVVPYFILWIYGLTAVRKRYDFLIGSLFSLAVCAMPNMVEYTTEIRMYGYVILFITAMCIHSAPFIEKDKERQIKGLKWGKVFPIFAYGLLACYTQYYAAVAVFCIYLFLVVWSIRKNVWQLGILFISGNLSLILYYPWISTVVSQVGTVSENYWIQDLTWRSIGGVVKYLTLPGFTTKLVAFAFAGILAILMAVVVFRNIKDAYMWLCFSPIIGIVIFGFAASFLIRPFFVYRYMLPGMGAFWYGIVIAVASSYEKAEDKADTERQTDDNKLRLARYSALVLIGIMVIVGIRDFWAFRGNELYRRVNMVKTDELFDELRKGDNLVIISNFDHVDGLLAFYMNDFEGREDNVQIPVLLYESQPEALIQKMVPGVGSAEDGVAVRDLLEDGKRVLFLGSFNSREDIVANWQEEYGIANENQGSYLMERYWFDVFELELENK